MENRKPGEDPAPHGTGPSEVLGPPKARRAQPDGLRRRSRVRCPGASFAAGAVLVLFVFSVVQPALSEPKPRVFPPFRASRRMVVPVPSAEQVAAAEYAWAEPCLDLALGEGVTLPCVFIPPGSFLMGSPDSEVGRDQDESPVRRVTISRGFYLGVTEVTQRQYLEVTDRDPSRFKGADRPVERVSWEDAIAFCRAVSRLTGHTVRLPTEAEWEYACRAGSTSRYFFGDDAPLLADHAWFDALAREETQPVATARPNRWGLFDLYGNVWEWCADWYAASYRGAETTDPKGPAKGVLRVLRGGSWRDGPLICRSANRARNRPNRVNPNYGFRVAVDIQ